MLNKNKLFAIFMLFLVFCSLQGGHVYAATSVQVIALFKDRAMLSVNGKKAKIIHSGKTYDGVKLISSNTSEAIVQIDGKRKTLKLNGTLVLDKSLGSKPSNSYSKEIQLFVNELGFFQSDGAINGESINFLVDTGANLVVINSFDANRINLDYKQGQKSRASTASGVAAMYVITADTMSIGGITLNNVKLGVIEGSFPESPLLGMTFLSRLNMQRQGNVMTLRRR